MPIFQQVQPTTITDAVVYSTYTGEKAYQQTSSGVAILGPTEGGGIVETTVPSAVSTNVTSTTGLLRIHTTKTSSFGGTQRAGVPKTGKGRRVYNSLARVSRSWHTTATQTAWIDYSDEIAGLWSLCADDTFKSLPQQLFTQYNLFRELQGLGDVLVPVNGAESCGFPGARIIWSKIVSSAFDQIGYTVVDQPGETFIVGQLGRGLDNPRLLCPATSDTFFPGDPFYEAARTFIANYLTLQSVGFDETIVRCCCSTTSGAPGGKPPMDLVVDIRP